MGNNLGRVLCIAVLCIAVCSSDGRAAPSVTASSSAPPRSPSPPTSTIPLPVELSGTFATLIASTDVPRVDQAGFWALTLSNDGTYEFGRAPSDAHPNTGTLTIEGDKVTFSNEKGEGACPGPGTYAWTRSGDALTFVFVADDCAVRKIQTTAHPYVRCSAGADTCVKPA